MHNNPIIIEGRSILCRTLQQYDDSDKNLFTFQCYGNNNFSLIINEMLKLSHLNFGMEIGHKHIYFV
jgi:hypothetical protein